MICPYCGKEMQRGWMSGDARSKLFWEPEGKKPSFVDRLVGIGRITAAECRFSRFRIETHFCDSCKKMIFDTDVGR